MTSAGHMIAAEVPPDNAPAIIWIWTEIGAFLSRIFVPVNKFLIGSYIDNLTNTENKYFVTRFIKSHEDVI